MKADHRTDGGPHLVGGGAHGATALPQRVGRVCHVIGRAQVIAVGRDALAQPAVGHGQTVFPGAQQDFTGTKGAGAEHHAAGAQHKFVGAVERAFGRLERLLPGTALGGAHAVHHPVTAGVGHIGAVRHIEHADPGEQLGTGLCGTWQVGFIQAELGIVVTARAAVATTHAGIARAQP